MLTGGTSGIGAATAQRLASCVDTLVLLSPDPAPPVRPGTVQADFTDLSQVAEAAASIHADVETVALRQSKSRREKRSSRAGHIVEPPATFGDRRSFSAELGGGMKSAFDKRDHNFC